MPEEEEQKEFLKRSTTDLKLLADYTLLNFNEIMELDCYTYKVLLKDAFIYKMSQSKEGQEYLENAWILQQSAPDREALRKTFKKEVGD